MLPLLFFLAQFSKDNYNQMQTVEEDLIEQSIQKFEENTHKIKKCLAELSDTEVWKKPNTSSNSIGNLILHLCGNITQYIISSLGETPDHRERDKEFSVNGGNSKEELLDKLTSTIVQATQVIKNLDPNSFLRIRSVQGYQLSAVGIILHVVEHYSYHTGQIIFWTKLLTDKDLGLYAHVNLNQKNK